MTMLKMYARVLAELYRLPSTGCNLLINVQRAVDTNGTRPELCKYSDTQQLEMSRRKDQGIR